MRGVMAIVAALAVAVPLHATCLPPQPIATGPLSDRFTALIATDKFRDVPANIAAWRALLADAAATPGVAPEIVARSQTWLAWSLDYLDQTDAALAAAVTADRVATAAGLTQHRFYADVLTTLSMVKTDLGKPDDGAAAAGLALAMRDGPASAEASFAHNALASIAYARGDYPAATAEYGAATELAVACLAPGEALIVNQMASYAGTLYMVGRVEDALAANERAAAWALANLTPDNPVITLALGNLGVMLRSAGRYAEAEAALRRVVDLEGRYQKGRWYYRAISLSNFASVIEAQGRHAEAEALWLTSSEFHRKATIKRDPVTPAYPLRFAADAAQARGDFALALTRRAEGLRLVEPDVPADHPELARARIEYAQTLTLLHRPAEALALAEPAIAVVRAKLAAGDIKRLTAEVAFARIVAAVRGAEAGYVIAAPVAARLETKLLDAATSRGELLRYGKVFSASFAAVTDLALAAHHDAAGFHALQLANLSDIVIVSNDVATRAAADSPVAGATVRALQDAVRARQLLDRSRAFAAAANNPVELTRLDAAIVASDAATAAAATRLERNFPAFRSLGRPVPVSLAAVVVRLNPGEVILAPLPVEDGTLAIAVTRAGLTWRKTAPARPAVEALVRRIDRSIAAARSERATTAPFDTAAAAALFAAIDPGPALTGAPQVTFYASGSLATISPALLVTRLSAGDTPLAGTAWLIRDHAVTIAPTLAGPPPRRGPVAGGFLGIGAPIVAAVAPGGSAASDDPTFQPLPRAAAELRALAAAIGGPGELLLGHDATLPAVLAAVAHPAATIAFATHAVAAGAVGDVAEPALLLTGNGSTARFLGASTIAALHLDADWVILSACASGGSSEAGGPAYSGLAAAFLHAGARALLVSQWAVRDDAAARVTVATLRATAAGVPRAVALQRAMLAVMADRRLPQAAHPATWAPFVLIGS